MRCLKNFHLIWAKVTAMRIFFTLLCGKIGSSFTLLDSNQYFDRVFSPNFGHEITFYGLGLNHTNLTGFSQQTVQTIMICKTIFRVIPGCLTAFAERQDNGTVLCTYTQRPIYELPTVLADKTKEFAFFKDLNATVAFQYNGAWSYLGSMGKFYIFRGYGYASNANTLCKRDYPNGHSLRPQTKKDLTTFYGISPDVANYKLYSLDLTCVKGSMVWGDDTSFTTTETGSILKPSDSSASKCTSGLMSSFISSTEYYIPYSDYMVLVVCEVNPFSMP